MQKRLWLTACAFAPFLLAAGCGQDTASPTAPADDAALISDLAPDLELSAAAGQASLPGLTTLPAPTYAGSISAADQCTYDGLIGRVVCAPVVRDGLTIMRSLAFYTAAGVAQPKRDADTRSVNTRVAVKGTVTTPKGPVAVDRASSLTVSGVGRGAVTHTLNGTESGSSVGTFSTNKGSVTTTERFEAATKEVVVPAEAKPAFPLSGTTSRSSTVTVSLAGGPTRTSTSSQVATYNGTSSVPVVIVRDGKSRTCTRDLATGKLACP